MTPTNEARPAETGDYRLGLERAAHECEWMARGYAAHLMQPLLEAANRIRQIPDNPEEEPHCQRRDGKRPATPDKPVDLGADAETPCTDCDDTGITTQTERRCSCQPPINGVDAERGAVVKRLRKRIDPWRDESTLKQDIVALIDLLASVDTTIERLRAAITRALQCTPSIRVVRDDYSPERVRHVIQYDCGGPWEILRTALSASTTQDGEVMK